MTERAETGHHLAWLTSLATRFTRVAPGRWLGLMLLALHAAVVFDADATMTRAFLLAHYGLFLLWQPLVRSEARIEPRLALPVFAMAALLVLVDSTWVMALWLAILAGLVGAVATSQNERGPRLAYLFALAYLLALLLAWVLPQSLGGTSLPDELRSAARYGLPLLPLAILFLPATRQRSTSSTLDFIYGLMLSLLIMVMALGVFAVVAVAKVSYAWALVQTLLGMAALLLALSWLWNPRAGFAGLGQVTSRYLLSVGLPFEGWAQRLATLAERERDPESFVRDALGNLNELTWIRGGHWQAARGEDSFGEPAAHRMDYAFHGLTLTWYSARPLTPALALHVRLLSQLLGYFYAAKVREQTLREQAYSQAIHDTGARLTHDVKNILQSLKTLLAAADTSTPEDSERLLALMKRQLPQLAARLSQTVDKLKQPTEMDVAHVACASLVGGAADALRARRRAVLRRCGRRHAAAAGPVRQRGRQSADQCVAQTAEPAGCRGGSPPDAASAGEPDRDRQRRRCARTRGAQSFPQPGGVGFRAGRGAVSGRAAGCALGVPAGTVRQSGGTGDVLPAGYGEQSEPVGHMWLTR